MKGTKQEKADFEGVCCAKARTSSAYAAMPWKVGKVNSGGAVEKHWGGLRRDGERAEKCRKIEHLCNCSLNRLPGLLNNNWRGYCGIERPVWLAASANFPVRSRLEPTARPLQTGAAERRWEETGRGRRVAS
jgi:hypothetical protein